MHDTCTTGTPGRNSFRRCSRNFGAGVRTATIASIWPPRTSQRASSLVSSRPQAGSVSMKSKTSIGRQTVGFPVCKRRRQEACARKVHQRYQQLFTVRLSHRKKASRRHQDRTASGTPGSSHVRNWPKQQKTPDTDRSMTDNAARPRRAAGRSRSKSGYAERPQA